VPALLLGPMLRYLDATSATIWMQTDEPAQVEVLGRRARTFAVAGRHYALVVLEDLPPEPTAYDVTLDGEHVWPLPGADPSLICPPVTDRLYSLAFGSCRVAAPLEDEQAGTDALHALAERVRGSSPAMRPDVLLLVGDQVYADDNISPQTKAFVESRRPATGGESPNDGDGTLDERPLEVCDVDEYVHLYIESWSPAEIRWLFSTLPSMMIFDDHDIRDDWNTSQTWRKAIQQTPWWQERIVSGLVTYWVYQHLGNLSPAELAEDETWQQVQQAAAQGQDAEGLLREMATRADAAADGGPGLRWSYCRDVGRSRIVVLDSRCNRKVDDAQRLMVGDREWEWFREHATGDVDHLLIATSVPFLLPPGVHELEAWDEALCRGRWGNGAPGSASGCGKASTSSTGPPSVTPLRGWLRSSPTSGRASGGGHRRRSRSCRATSTSPTSPKPRSAAATTSPAASCRPCARRCATRCRQARGSASDSPPPPWGARSAGCSPAPPGHRPPTCRGRSPADRLSATSWQRSTSTAPSSTSRSSQLSLPPPSSTGSAPCTSRDWHRRGSRSGRTLHGLAAPSIPPAFVQEESRWLVDPVLTG